MPESLLCPLADIRFSTYERMIKSLHLGPDVAVRAIQVMWFLVNNREDERFLNAGEFSISGYTEWSRCFLWCDPINSIQKMMKGEISL